MPRITLTLALLLVASLRADPPRKMTLAFSEDFDGTELDKTKWVVATQLPAVNVKVQGGKLQLGICQDSAAKWVGSSVSTRGRFEQARGYFEASIRFGKFQGHHGAFRLINEKINPSEKYGEIYVAEGFGGDVVINWMRYNDGVALREDKPKNLKPLPVGQAGGQFNTYGVEWAPREVTWFINGKKTHTVRFEMPQEKLLLVLGTTVSEYERPKLDPAKLPDDVEIDWVKAWR